MPILVADRARPHGALVRTLTLSRPERRNALDPAHLDELAARVRDAEADARVRALVVAGEGRAFCAGYDLSAPFPEADAIPDAIVVRTMGAVRACALPTIARLHGPAFGAGFELAISCDVRVASTSASLCLPPARLGIAYAPEGLARLVSLAGTSAARRLAFTGDAISADGALSMGLVDELVAPEDLDARVAALADAMADTAPLAVRAMKRTLNALEHRLSPEERARAEADRLACYGSKDALEGLASFAEKRAARFQGE